MATETPVRVTSRYSLRNMALSIGVVLGIVVLLVVLLPRPHYDAVKQVDPREAILSAQRVAPYHVLVPTGLPAGWRATSAQVTGPDDHHVVHLHIGYVSPRGAYVALEESNQAATPFIELESAHGKFRGQAPVNGQTWEQRFSANQSEYSLDRTDPSGVTVVVGGSSVARDAPYAELMQLVDSLH
ncbi:MAG: DUF4245 domain-containing protein [Actinomycetes bacterium]